MIRTAVTGLIATVLASVLLAGCGSAPPRVPSPSAFAAEDVAVRLRNASLQLRPGETMDMVAQRAAVFCVAHFEGKSNEMAMEAAFGGTHLTTGPHRGVVSEFITAALRVMCPLVAKHLKQPA
jgi:hypothetical protein